jgi:hypothetical protein
VGLPEQHEEEHLMTTTSARVWRGIAVAAAFAFAWAPVGVAAQPGTGTSKQKIARPSADQIERAIIHVLLCGWADQSQRNALSHDENEKVLEFIQSQRDPHAPDNGRLHGRFNALGVTFDEVDIVAGQGGAFAVGWSSTGSMQMLSKALEQRGLRLQRRPVSVGRIRTVNALKSISITPGQQIAVQLVPGRGSLRPNSWEPEGVTLTCSATAPSAEYTESAIGVPTTLSIQDTVQRGVRKSKEWVDNIIAKGFEEPMEAVSAYKWLEAEQVAALLGAKRPGVDRALAHNKNAALSPEQIQQLLDRNDSEVLQALVETRLDALLPQQREALKRNPHTQEAVLLRSTPAEALAAFERVVKSGDLNRLNSVMFAMPNLSNEMVDRIIDLGTPAMRHHLAMQSQHAYTPQQVAKLLGDPNKDVRIGVLRRSEVPITAAQMAEGINHADADLAFWYHQRKEYLPTPAQVEQGLTSPDAPTRRGWVFDKRITLTEAQVRRALQDPALLVPALGRQEVKLTEADFDRCTRHEDVGVRFACVSRLDYPLNQARFEAIVTDWNGNVLRNLLERKLPMPVDYEPYVARALDNANDKVLIAIGRADALQVSDELIRKAASTKSAAVRQAFCGRNPPLCKQ